MFDGGGGLALIKNMAISPSNMGVLSVKMENLKLGAGNGGKNMFYDLGFHPGRKTSRRVIVDAGSNLHVSHKGLQPPIAPLPPLPS